jgi:hypothetical protein
LTTQRAYVRAHDARRLMHVTYDSEKFRELIVYIADRCADDPTFGDTKLNKILYFADFLGYSDLGQPITGARYQKLEHGPAAVALRPVRDELEREGAVSVDMAPAGRTQRLVTKALRPARTELFEREELDLVDELIRVFRGRTARHMSDLSHERSPGWNLVELQDDIPNETALISPDPPHDGVIERGRELAGRFGW